MLLMLLLLIPLGGLLHLRNYALPAMGSAKFILNFKLLLKFMLHSLILYLWLFILNNIHNMELSTRIELLALIICGLVITYLIFYDSYLYNKYPIFYLIILSLCTIIFVYCFSDIALNIALNINFIESLILKVNHLKDYWFKIKNSKINSNNSTNDSSGQGNPKPNSPKKGDATTDVEERKRRRRAASAKYRAKNRETIYEKERARYANNSEERIKQTTAWKKANPEKASASSKKAVSKWVENNRDKSRANSSKWRALNPDKVKANNDKYGAIKKAVTQLNKSEMAHYEGVCSENKELFQSWLDLSSEELSEVFKKKRIRKDLQNGFEFFKANPNYYKDINMDIFK